MTPDDYWNEDPEYSLFSWRYDVANNDTRLGYWEWIEAQKEESRRLNNVPDPEHTHTSEDGA